MERTHKSLIMKEVEKIVQGGPQAVNFAYSAELYVGDVRVEVVRVDFININGDYGEGFQDDLTVGFKVEPTVYQKTIYPNRNNLMVHITRSPLGEEGGAPVGGRPTIQKFRAFLKQEVDLLASQKISMDANQLNMMGFMDLALQVLDPYANKIRLFLCGANFRQMSPVECLISLLEDAIRLTKVAGRVVVPKIHIRPADNVNKRSSIVIPHMTQLHDLPHILQDSQGGIYNAGIRMYFRDDGFYVWPKYYMGSNPGTRKTLTIYNLPANDFPHAERTFRVTDYQVLVISTGTSFKYDAGLGQELNEGNGIRFTDANKLLNGMVSVKGNKAVMRRGFANSEFMDGETGREENFAPVSRNRITSNPYGEVSRLAARKGFIEQFAWHNADPSLIFPGMDVKVIYIEGGRIIEREGSLAGADFHMSPKVDNFKSKWLTITGGLSVFVNKVAKIIG